MNTYAHGKGALLIKR